MGTGKVRIRHCILYKSQQGKTPAKTWESIYSFLGESIVSYDVCTFRFERFETGEFCLNYKQLSQSPLNRENNLESLVAENSAQTYIGLERQLQTIQKSF